jgi:hypothetical protein
MRDSKNGTSRGSVRDPLEYATTPRPGEAVTNRSERLRPRALFDRSRPVVRRTRHRKWYRNWAVSQLLIETMEEMKLIYPKPDLDVRALKKSLPAAA